MSESGLPLPDALDPRAAVDVMPFQPVNEGIA
jgi:hypothetical protein